MSEGPFSDTLRGELFKRRNLQLFGRLDDLVACDLCAQLLSLDALGDEPIHLLMSSSGGSIDAALSVVDVVDVIGVPVHATALGELAGAPIALFAACSLRRCSVRANFVFYEEPAEMKGNWQDLVAAAKRQKERLDAFAYRIAVSTSRRRTKDEVLADLAGRRCLDPPAAMAYGIVDEILNGTATVELVRDDG